MALISGDDARKYGRRASGMLSGKTSGKIVELIRGHPAITIPKMAERLGRSTWAVELQLAKLRDTGIVIRIGPAKGGHWEIIGDGRE